MKAELTWFRMPDGRHGFKGVVAGLRRQIIGGSREALEQWVEQEEGVGG
jgi:hypothetical protein